MKSIFLCSLGISVFLLFLNTINLTNKGIINSYKAGERLDYRVHYGLINAGEAKIEVGEKLYLVNEKVCLKAICSGRSTGAFDLMMRIRDSWGSYIDTLSQSPQKGFRDIQEGKYKLKEATYFDLTNKAVS